MVLETVVRDSLRSRGLPEGESGYEELRERSRKRKRKRERLKQGNTKAEGDLQGKKKALKPKLVGLDIFG